MINKKDDHRRVTFINAQKTIGGIIARKNNAWKDKEETTRDGRTFHISHQVISASPVIVSKSGSKEMDKTTASFFHENGISFNVADSSSFAHTIEEICQTKSLSKLQNPFPHTITWGAPWSTGQLQVKCATCSPYSCYC